MPDICDRANEEMFFLASLQRPSRETPQQPSATHCQFCEAPIPERRQAAVPGVQTCADCQSATEDIINNRRRLFATPTAR
ncbi:TraR/DksA C4-type zinc finger protein [Enterobacter sp. SECR19-1250]|uniref:TraR/DksA C4-type zinc finger protein n=1 Tax=Enterobacter sp. SECR19-1250 TaxID=2749084 RepID=UPI0015B41699|nr:TraR/DksA C4-type zinc finger protein [Enterobacter sp. SECR19-1250]NWJ78867.1 TraR/DksA C4-type zinc finger protein [Enterobacter sp. SECR19-1250]